MLLLGWAINAGGGLGRILNESSRLQTTQVPFWTLFPAAVTANVGYWATLSLNIPDFTRYARHRRRQPERLYTRGVNWRAMAVLVLAILPVVPGFLRAATTPGGAVANPTFFDTLYTYAWFVTFGLSVLLYVILNRRSAAR